MTEIRVFRHGLQHVDKNNVFALGKHFGSDTWDGRRAGARRVGAPEKLGSKGWAHGLDPGTIPREDPAREKTTKLGAGEGKQNEKFWAVRERRAGWGKGGPVAPRNDKRKPLKPTPTHRESSTHPRNRYPHPRPETSTHKHTNHRHAHTHTQTQTQQHQNNTTSAQVGFFLAPSQKLIGPGRTWPK